MDAHIHRHIANDSPDNVEAWAEIMVRTFFVYFITDHLIEDSRVPQVLRFLLEGEEGHSFSQSDFLRRVKESTDRQILSLIRMAKRLGPTHAHQLLHLLQIQQGQQGIIGKKRTRAILEGMTPESMARVVTAIFQRDEEFLKAHDMDFEAAQRKSDRVFNRIRRIANQRSADEAQRDQDLTEAYRELSREARTRTNIEDLVQMVSEDTLKLGNERQVIYELGLILDDLVMRKSRLNSTVYRGVRALLNLEATEFPALGWFANIVWK